MAEEEKTLVPSYDAITALIAKFQEWIEKALEIVDKIVNIIKPKNNEYEFVNLKKEGE